MNVLILVSLNVLFESALPLVRHYLPASTSAISLPLIALFGLASIRFMLKSGYPAAFFGLGLRHLFLSLVEAIVFTVPVLALVTGLKALLATESAG